MLRLFFALTYLSALGITERTGNNYKRILSFEVSNISAIIILNVRNNAIELVKNPF